MSYTGPERRTQALCDCKNDRIISALQTSIDELTQSLGQGQEELKSCKTQVDMDISTLHKDMAALRSDVAVMRADMHILTKAVGEMKDSLSQIANSLQSIADFPETWVKLKGFWSVLNWIKSNWFLLGILFSFMFVIAYEIVSKVAP